MSALKRDGAAGKGEVLGLADAGLWPSAGPALEAIETSGKNLRDLGLGRPARNINPYLVDGPDIVVTPRTGPICDVPSIVFGSMPNEAKPRRRDWRAKSLLRSWSNG